VRPTGYTLEEITGQHISCLYEDRETRMLEARRFFLGIALKQGFLITRDAPHFLVRVLIMSMGNMEGSCNLYGVVKEKGEIK
jgi:hypothetical protein